LQPKQNAETDLDNTPRVEPSRGKKTEHIETIIPASSKKPGSFLARSFAASAITHSLGCLNTNPSLANDRDLSPDANPPIPVIVLK